MPLTFFSLGSGSCGNCYYISTESDAIIIDCGVGIRRFKKLISEYGLKMSKVRAVLVTHDHADHIKAAGKISKEYNLPVYATYLVHEGMDRNWQSSVKIPRENRHNVEPDEPFQIGDFRITAFLLPHDATENVGYHLEVGEHRFTVMTDVGDATEKVKHYIAQSTHLILEANYDEEMLQHGRYPEILKERITCGHGHLSNKKAAHALAENFHPDLKQVWLCHLSEENNHPELARKTVETILRSYGIVAGVDFSLEVLRRKIPTGPFFFK
ncbi:MAG: MBL fold metallo-hydrolase [Bacteroidaceae bacterium]|jgi:phosphoribosyl 1,2-cyclic phosphodiesterase|nr:MBL fold metallo-hydrolase [Bacteroidaceae bacterium]